MTSHPAPSAKSAASGQSAAETPDEKPPGGLVKAKNAASARFKALRAKWTWLDHVIVGYGRYKLQRGDHFAAAVTFFSFLSLFPLILLGVSVLGFVLNSDPALQTRLLNSIADNLPGSFGDTISKSIKTATENRASVGLVGVGTLAFTGLGWIANLRSAVEGVWGIAPPKRSFLAAKAADGLVLIGFGLALLVSLGLTAAGSTLMPPILRAISLDDVPGIFVITRIVSFAIAVLGDMLVFGWLLIRLPKVRPPRAVALRGVILAAVGFEVLKVVGTYYIARVSSSPTVGVFGSVIGILVFLNLVSRFLLFCVAWLATDPGMPGAQAITAVPDVSDVPVVMVARPPAGLPPDGLSPGATAATLVGAGAVLGASATVGFRWWWRRP